MANSLDGPYCRHGVNGFDPRGCAACTAEYELHRRFAGRRKPVTKANGHVPVAATFIKEKFKPTESD